MDRVWTAIEYGSEFPIEIGRGAPLADGGGFVYVRSGRDALRLVARALRDSGVDAVLMPCYCCECMEWPFSDEGVRVIYYRVLKGLRVDVADIAEKAAANRGAALLYMHYFGLPSIERGDLVELKEKYSLRVIRDVTHDMLDYDFKEGSSVDDFAVSSLRKWAGLPEGGLVFSTGTDLPSVAVSDDRYEVLRREAMATKRRYLEMADDSLKPLYLDELAQCNNLLDQLRTTSGMGGESRILGGGVDWLQAAKTRRENSSLLAQGLDALGVHYYHCPGSAPLWVSFIPGCNRDELQKSLSSFGLYCPYLWPIPESARGCSPYIDDFVGSMLCLPCDQRYDSEDVARMLEILAMCLKEAA
ncbi:hypothetical protein [Enorma massiliensis]|uniref:hypothetical protein n=1 Tax=Enorma massiliensis TaxID=1472761 RepID=UPI003A90C661